MPQTVNFLIEATGRPLLSWQAEAQSGAALAGAEVEHIHVDVARDELYARAEARFDQMLAAGGLEEVRALLDADSTLPMMKAIGMPELAAYLRGELAYEDAVVKAKTATRNYIKRQLTWWRGQMKRWAPSGSTP